MKDSPSWGRRLRRLVVAAAAFWAVFADFHGDPAYFFSYFTILTNLAIGVWFLGAVVFGPRFDRASGIRLALTIYGLVTLSVYWVLLSPTHHPEGIAAVANLLLHLGIPLAMAIEDWFVPWPKLGRTAPLWVLVWPLVYAVLALVRGEVTGWYPYFFFNKTEFGGWPGLTVFILGLLTVFTGLAYLWRSLVHCRHKG